MGVLGKVTKDLDTPRGPDVVMTVTVPDSWLGKDVEVELPRNLHCAFCDGGGCDRCERAGAVSIRDRRAQVETLTVRLPDSTQGKEAICIRIPESGGHSSSEGEGRGHLMLTVKLGEVESSEVTLAAPAVHRAPVDRAELMKRSLWMAVVLILLFLGMLRLSGWL